MTYQYLKENETIILNKGECKRFTKYIYGWENKAKQKEADLKKWKEKIYTGQAIDTAT